MAIDYNIEKKICCLSERSSGWSKELNLVSWGNNAAKYDLREWDSTHEKMGKGITLSEEELLLLYESLKKLFDNGFTYEPQINGDIPSIFFRKK